MSDLAPIDLASSAAASGSASFMDTVEGYARNRNVQIGLAVCAAAAAAYYFMYYKPAHAVPTLASEPLLTPAVEQQFSPQFEQFPSHSEVQPDETAPAEQPESYSPAEYGAYSPQ